MPRSANLGLAGLIAWKMQVSHRVYVSTDLGLREGDRLVHGQTAMLVIGAIDAAGMGRLWQIDANETVSAA